MVPVPGTAVSFCTDSVNFSRDKIVQIIEALLPEWGTSRVLFTKWWSTGQICWHFTSRSIRQKETSTGNRFMHSVLPFTDRCTNVLLSVITRPAHPRRWYYAGCGNNMEEQQYDACCCSARSFSAIREPV